MSTPLIERWAMRMYGKAQDQACGLPLVEVSKGNGGGGLRLPGFCFDFDYAKGSVARAVLEAFGFRA